MVLKAMIGSLVASVIVFAGCGSDVGTTSPSKQASTDYFAKEAETAGTKAPGKGGAPKSIKGKLFTKSADEIK